MTISILNLGISNLGSLKSALDRIGKKCIITSESSVIMNSEKLIIPGVGSFPDAMSKINALKLFSIIKAFSNKKKPILGICLGMQLLANFGYEYGKNTGLGLIPGEVKKIPKQKVKIIPNVGWCKTNFVNSSLLLEKIRKNSFFYFVHSYYFECNKKYLVALSGNSNFMFPSIIQNRNIFGVQFHPEKSYDQGLILLSNFCNYEYQ
tara:strand:+ start:80 stop:697 length:618 start_codon:yes stop_codon:yes gene_type:complete